MPVFEYRVIPAPKKGAKAKGVKGAENLFANTLQDLMNELGREGWEYQRTDSLPSQERSGLTKTSTVQRSMLVFRRIVDAAPVEKGAPTISATSATPATDVPEVTVD